MGKNTPARRDFIIENLKVEEDVVEEVPADFAMEKAALAEAG
jgi:hypothetical protein